MNIWKMLTSCRGAINKMAAVSAGGVVLFGGLAMYNYVTSRPAAEEAKVRNLASLMRNGNVSEYSNINVGAGDAQLATIEEQIARHGSSFAGDTEDSSARFSQAINGQVFQGGEAGLGMGANRAALLDGTGGQTGEGTNASDALNAAMAALNQVGKMGEKGGAGAEGAAAGAEGAAAGAEGAAAGINGKGGHGNFRAVDFARAGGHNLGSGDNGGFGGLSRSEGNSRIGVDSMSGVLAAGRSFAAAETPETKGGRDAKFLKGSRGGKVGRGALDGKRGNIELKELAEDSRHISTHMEYETANAGSRPLMNGIRSAASIDLTGSGLNNSSLLGISDTSDSKSPKINIPGLDQKLDETQEKTLEKEKLGDELKNLLLAFIIATIAAIIVISIVKHMGPWGIAGAAAATLIVVGLGVAVGLKLGKYIEISDGNWDSLAIWSTIGLGAGAIGLALAWIIGGTAATQSGLTGFQQSALGTAGNVMLDKGSSLFDENTWDNGDKKE